MWLASPHEPAPGRPAKETQGAVKLFAKIGAFTEARRLEALSLYPYFKPITGGDGTTLVIEGRPRLNMGSNNYLGLTHHQTFDRPVGIGNVGRQAASAVGYVSSFFEHGDVEVRLVAFGTAGGTHAGGITADN